jgi:methyl-accepting chemotaxis protein
MSGHIHAVTLATRESGQAAREMLHATDGLSRDSEHMRDGLDRFLGQLRAM